MFSSCAKKLGFRWSLLTFFVCAVGQGIYIISEGSLPATDVLRTFGTNQVSVTEVSRYFDSLVAAVLMWPVFACITDSSRLQAKYGRPGSGDPGVGLSLLLGLVGGAIASIILSINALTGAIICAGIASVFAFIVFILLDSGYDIEYEVATWKPLGMMIFAACTSGALATMFQGIIPGICYSFGALVLTIVMYYVLVLLRALVYTLSPSFRRVMFKCD
jgi:hypothetical protein